MLLQELSLEVESLDRQIDALPQKLVAIEVRIAEARADVERAKSGQSDVGRRRREQELELKSAEEKIKRYHEQLMSVKSNEEYRALNTEVGHERERIAQLEEQILIDMEAADELTAETARADSTLSEATEELKRESERIDVTQVELRREREALASRVTEQSKSLPPKLVSLYSKLANGRGVAIAVVKDQACSVCRMRTRPQILSQLRVFERLHQCESCQRILFWDASVTE